MQRVIRSAYTFAFHTNFYVVLYYLRAYNSNSQSCKTSISFETDLSDDDTTSLAEETAPPQIRLRKAGM